MRNILVATVIAMLPVSLAAAQSSGAPKPDKATPSSRLLPVKGAAAVNTCAAYGAGFVKVDGGDTCVKIGGAVSISGAAGSH
jgi:hypothetical protein